MLRQDNRFCCLGVLCEVAGIDSRPIFDSTRWEYNVPNSFFPWSSNIIPSNIAGLNYKECNKLAILNDHGDSFDTIADYIETNIECEPNA